MQNAIFKFSCFFCLGIFISNFSFAQLKWENVDASFQPLPSSVHVYKSTSLVDDKPNIAYYVEADLKDKKLDFTVDTTKGRRLTPSKYFEKNANPLVVVNTTFFSFETNRSLNTVIKNGKLVAQNWRRATIKEKDSTLFFMPHLSAIGINKRRVADIAWIKTDTLTKKIFAIQNPPTKRFLYKTERNTGYTTKIDLNDFRKWKMQTAVGGGPVLIQKGEIKITNEEEMMFTGKAINDKHPRTAMGYTKDKKLIILVIEGRNPGIAEGASLPQEAQILIDLGCWEALNLDGGGSSCMLVNGKETIKPSDKEGQRAVPAVFIIKEKSK